MGALRSSYQDRMLRGNMTAQENRDGQQRRAVMEIQAIRRERAVRQDRELALSHAALAMAPPPPAPRVKAPVLPPKITEKIVELATTQAPWMFLSNHSHVLLLIAANPKTRMRDLADKVGITERAIHRLVDDLAAGGYLKIFKTGRRNMYEVQMGMRLRHPTEAHRSIGELVDFVRPAGEN